MGQPTDTTLAEIFRRESRSFLQYVDQSSPYSGPAEKPVLDRIHELARTEAATLTGFAEFLDKSRVSIPHFGAFPTSFTNYNFVAVKKLVKPLVDDQAKGLVQLDLDAASLPVGEGRTWVEKIAASKRLHLSELEKMEA
jgi:hypothetical protein